MELNWLSTPTKVELIFPGSYSLRIGHGTFDFLPSRTIFWREAQTLLAADLHWGKTEVFQRHGVPIPRGVLKDDLSRLSSALATTQAKRLIVLGDLIHATTGITSEVIEEVGKWRANFPNVFFHLVLGNHDRHFEAPLNWNINEESRDYSESEFLFSHDEILATDKYVFSGHLHPMARIERRGDSLRLPCFQVKQNCTQLPAFSFFTGGVDVKRAENELILVVAEEQVIKL